MGRESKSWSRDLYSFYLAHQLLDDIYDEMLVVVVTVIVFVVVVVVVVAESTEEGIQWSWEKNDVVGVDDDDDY